ncbi:UBN2_3 domain-containing protein, partial [Cephalotus follicularis]
IVLSWIMNTDSKELFNGIVYSTNAQSVWKDLKERFDKVNGSRIFSIHGEIGSLVQGNMTISVYFNKLRQLWDEYASLATLPSCGCATSRAYLKHDQQQKLLQFLMGLNESYRGIRRQTLMMNPLPTVGQAYSLISQEESHRGIIAGSNNPFNMPAMFYTNTTKYKAKEEIRCEHCNWIGHRKENCYKLIGYPHGHRQHKGNQKRGGNLNSDNQRFIKPAVNNIISDSNPDQSIAPLVFTPDQY